jgi:hypothetical protein
LTGNHVRILVQFFLLNFNGELTVLAVCRWSLSLILMIQLWLTPLFLLHPLFHSAHVHCKKCSIVLWCHLAWLLDAPQ